MLLEICAFPLCHGGTGVKRSVLFKIHLNLLNDMVECHNFHTFYSNILISEFQAAFQFENVCCNQEAKLII